MALNRVKVFIHIHGEPSVGIFSFTRVSEIREQKIQEVAKLICEDCPHQGDKTFPCNKKLPCVYAEGLADQILAILEADGWVKLKPNESIQES